MPSTPATMAKNQQEKWTNAQKWTMSERDMNEGELQ